MAVRLTVDPNENLAVAFAGRELVAQRCRIDSDEFHKALIEWAVVLVFTEFVDNVGPPFIEHARQEDVTAETVARAARRAFGQIWGSNVLILSSHFIWR